ncbi:DUF6438 domain-containing protein [Methylomagnum ishizawai]|uniref:DUF6438 domain-containing protein n=1 Tax=Methylomagnum ishizawai TaxID=1760988 RepID=UPI003CCE7016
MGKNMSEFYFIFLQLIGRCSFLILCMLIFSVSPVILAAEMVPVIILETEGPCDCCVIYKIEIFKNGKVHWHGKAYVNAKCDRYKWIGKDSISRLRALHLTGVK